MKRHRSPDSLGAGIFLIGLGILFLLPGRVGFFPWILVVIGLAGLPSALSGSRGWAAWQGLFWLVGLAVLFATNSIWPGILILAGASMLMGAVAGGAKAKKAAEPDVAHEPVTTTRLPHVAPPEPELAPTADIELDDPGTAPLSYEDIDALEAELAETVEGARMSEVAAQAEDVVLPPTPEPDPEPDGDADAAPDDGAAVETDDQP
jgi:hypothetical protein